MSAILSEDVVNVKIEEDVINVTVDNYVRGVDSFVKLTDTPSNYIGQAGKYPKVNLTEDGLEFDVPAGGGDMLAIDWDKNSNGIIDNAENIITKIEAQENLPAYTIVTVDGYIADSTNIAHLNKVFGITIESVNSGLACKVLTFGYIQNTNWNFQQGTKLFLNGTTIDTVPSNTGFSQEIGNAFNSNTLYFNLQRPIKF